MRVSVRAGGERAASVTVLLVELDKGPGPEMDVGRGVRAGLGAIALELIVGHGPVLPGLTVPPLAGESPCGPAGHLRTALRPPDRDHDAEPGERSHGRSGPGSFG